MESIHLDYQESFNHNSNSSNSGSLSLSKQSNIHHTKASSIIRFPFILNNKLNEKLATINAVADIESNKIVTKQITSNFSDKIPDYITKDNPKTAIFVARKIISDFLRLADDKIEAILAQEVKDKPIFKSLCHKEDPIYDQILDGIGAISEFCLPSLLKIVIDWYHHQLSAAESPRRRIISVDESQQLPSSNNLSNTNEELLSLPQLDCSSPVNTNINNESSSLLFGSSGAVLRSPTPSTPDTSFHLSITSNSSLLTLPDRQSPSSTCAVVDSFVGSPNTANTSTSTTTNVSSTSSSSTNTNNNITTNNNSNVINDEINSSNASQRAELVRLRRLLIEYTFCQSLIKIFGHLGLHPGHEDLIGEIVDIAYEHFRYREPTSADINASHSSFTSAPSPALGTSIGGSGSDNLHGLDISDVNILASKYAEVLGVLAQTRFQSVRERFKSKLSELKSKESTLFNIQSIVIWLSSMNHFRVKMAPIEEFESSLQFLQELADYFIEVRHKSVRHAIASLFVEIMVPLASAVKNEVKIPCLKNLVDTLWLPAMDLCSRKKHSITLFPLVTCLLCLSQRSFFLANWSGFLSLCISSLKNRDQKMSRVALESLYRLIWFYMIRVKCESNNITQTRLNAIVEALFPRGSRTVVPRDAPLGMLVDIIQFIAQERLDFAMRHIIFDLLSVDRSFKMITTPERMNVGLQAFLTIADNLQHKEGEPPVPKSLGVTNNTPNNSFSDNHGNHLNNNSTNHLQNQIFHRKKNHSKMLNDDTAKSIGIHPFCNTVQRSFNDILKILDTQIGRPMMLTAQFTNKDSMITNDQNPKIALFKTCVSAIPRLMPEGMSRQELIDLLSRLTIHANEELRNYAFESLKILITDFPDWRLEAVEGFTSFLVNQIDESHRNLVENAMKMLLQFFISWKICITAGTNSTSSGNLSGSANNYQSGAESDKTSNYSIVTIHSGYESISSRQGGTGGQVVARKNRALTEMRLIQSELSITPFDRLISVIQKVEGAALVMLCNHHPPTRKIATTLLKESRMILKCYLSWNCMEQLGLKSPTDDVEDEDFPASLKGSLSADNVSRITTTSANGFAHSSMTSMNTQNALLSSSVSKVCISNSNSCNNYNKNEYQSLLNDNDYSDVENNLADCAITNDNNSKLIFRIALILLESESQKEYMLALRFLKKLLPNLPMDVPEFLDELECSLYKLGWENFSGIHSLVMKGTKSSETYDLSIFLLDQLTPILKHQVCCGGGNNSNCDNMMQKSSTSSTLSSISLTSADEIFPSHVMILLTHLMSNYDDPTPFSLNIARRISMWCDENSTKLGNLATVMTLYSRRSFSKDCFQWIKCVVKYLYDAYPKTLPQVIPLLMDLVESRPKQAVNTIAPIVYCILTYVEVVNLELELREKLNAQLSRLYVKYIGTNQWRDAVLIFKLIISRSSQLAANNFGYCRELPGRTLEFTLDVDSIPVIACSHLQCKP